MLQDQSSEPFFVGIRGTKIDDPDVITSYDEDFVPVWIRFKPFKFFDIFEKKLKEIGSDFSGILGDVDVWGGGSMFQILHRVSEIG